LTEESIFSQYLKRRNTILKNKNILQTSYIPDQLPHRTEQVDSIASVISAALRGDKPSNIMISGKTGTGKTAVVKFIGNELRKADISTNVCEFVYINCEVVDTHYGILYSIGSHSQTDPDRSIPPTGWSTERVYAEMCGYIDSQKKVFIIVLDEIDRLLLKGSDDVLYHLLVINENLKNSKVSMIGISNNLKFVELLGPRVRSRLGEEKVYFRPYVREQLEDILRERAKLAFEEGTIEEGVIPYCAVISAQETGDARRALDLLRVASDIAERNGDTVVTEAHVKSAKNKIEVDTVIEAVKTLTDQSKTVLMSIIKSRREDSGTVTTGEVYSVYEKISDVLGTSILSKRRVTDLISELDMLGIVHAHVRSFGRAGRTKEIELSIPKEAVDILEADELMRSLRNYIPPKQTTLM
jgi:cell division control protein 6